MKFNYKTRYVDMRYEYFTVKCNARLYGEPL